MRMQFIESDMQKSGHRKGRSQTCRVGLRRTEVWVAKSRKSDEEFGRIGTINGMGLRRIGCPSCSAQSYRLGCDQELIQCGQEVGVK
jgi:hypothetical protein